MKREGIHNFIDELRRRKVYRAAAAYAIVGWIIIQVVATVFPILALPAWALRAVVVSVLACFPLVLAFAWAYELGPGGLRKTVDSPADPTRSRGFAPSRRNVFALVLVGAVISIVCGYFLLARSAASPLDKSIAVLPFDNFSDDKDNEHFADGIHDDVLTSLARIEDLKVISRTSVMQYRAKAHNIRAIAQELGVSAVLEGSVRRSGNRVRLVVQLIDALHDRHIWAQEYDRDLTDVFAIQSALAQEIANQLKAKLSPDEVTRIKERPTTNDEAYKLYLQAHAMYSRAEETLDTLQRAEQLYEKATQLDPSFALAFARLAHIESWTYYLFDPTPERLTKARNAANEAMRLQPNAAESHLAAGYVAYYGDRDYERALREFEIARRDLPNDSSVFLAIASIERRQGKWKQSIMDYEKAVSLSPSDPIVLENLGLTYQAVRDFPAAAKAFDRAVALVPNSCEAKSLRATVEMEWTGDLSMMKNLLASLPPDFESFGTVALARFNVCFFQRKFDEALNVLWRSPLENLHGQTSTPLPKSFLAAQVYRLLPDREKAQAEYEHALSIAERALEQSPQDSARHALIGLIYAGLGRKDDAIRAGNRALELLPESKDIGRTGTDHCDGAHLRDHGRIRKSDRSIAAFPANPRGFNDPRNSAGPHLGRVARTSAVQRSDAVVTTPV